jgi:hypothetical protein
MNRRTHIEDDGAKILAGTEAPSSPARRAGLTAVIIPFPDVAAASFWESAGELDEDVFPLGSLAVKLVGNFLLPKLLVMRQDQS